jgi:hypothetical protein
VAALVTSIFLLSQQPGMIGPPAQTPIVPPRRDCAADADPDEIVVCGETNEDSPYRVPREFRNMPSDLDGDASASTRIWDNDTVLRYEDQVSGPFAYMNYGRQLDCQWRVAQQERQGRRPDCRARIKPDEPTDWQRRRAPLP